MKCDVCGKREATRMLSNYGYCETCWKLPTKEQWRRMRKRLGYKTFNGKTYRHSGYEGTKIAVGRKQKYYVDNGLLTRMIRTKHGYALYICEK